MQKFWFLSSIWFRNVSWCDAIKTSMCSKRNVVLSNVYTAINNYLSAKQGFEGASFWRGGYLLITVKTTKQLLFHECVYVRSLETNISLSFQKRSIYLFCQFQLHDIPPRLYYLHITNQVLYGQNFSCLSLRQYFFVLVEFLSLNRKSQNWNVFQQGIWNFRTLFLHTIHNCCWHCEVVVTVQTDHVNKKEDGTATNKEWILYADYIFLIWIIHCLHYDVYKVALC